MQVLVWRNLLPPRLRPRLAGRSCHSRHDLSLADSVQPEAPHRVLGHVSPHEVHHEVHWNGEDGNFRGTLLCLLNKVLKVSWPTSARKGVNNEPLFGHGSWNNPKWRAVRTLHTLFRAHLLNLLQGHACCGSSMKSTWHLKKRPSTSTWKYLKEVLDVKVPGVQNLYVLLGQGVPQIAQGFPARTPDTGYFSIVLRTTVSTSSMPSFSTISTWICSPSKRSKTGNSVAGCSCNFGPAACRGGSSPSCCLQRDRSTSEAAPPAGA